MLPAYAGMIRSLYGTIWGMWGAPRVCGDDPVLFLANAASITCSPRMRG